RHAERHQRGVVVPHVVPPLAGVAVPESMMPIVMAIIEVVVAILPVLANIVATVPPVVANVVARGQSILQSLLPICEVAARRQLAWSIVQAGAVAQAWQAAIACARNRASSDAGPDPSADACANSIADARTAGTWPIGNPITGSTASRTIANTVSRPTAAGPIADASARAITWQRTDAAAG